MSVAYDDVKILDTINGVMPNLLPLCFTGLIFYFLKKDIKVTYILAGIILFGILGAAISMF